MRLDEHHRNIIVGSHTGEIKVYDILSGVMTHQLEGHSKEQGEISFIGFGEGEDTIITTAWDRTIKVHGFEKLAEAKGKRSGASSGGGAKSICLRSKVDCHERDITCADYHHNLGLIATGAQDNTVKLFDYETLREVHHFEDAHDSDVTMVKFLKPFPLLLTGDMEGNLFIWMTGGNYQCIMNWINTPGIMQFSQITAIDVYYREETPKLPRKFLLILGDEAGMVRIQNIEAILDKLPFLKPAPPISQKR